ncbi:HU family DNA-binding protein [Denitrobaculum tricleocarpae]|uniref:HU family DNA-binding protein n=1 Tax=Denitrobaculum tricleocarpae TaxID=2591009 RepID=A0A545TAZ9_9PROT|nr:HU family DNA-binding protein [Denitrobaculum tricleocarpae]TQV74390.1 HU family DNA-binding protein [Denitrobaculum tricleocarpae]
MAKKPVKKATAKKAAPKKAAPKTAQAAKKPAARRYKATPEGTSDRQHLIEVIQGGTGCSAAAARETLGDLIGTITTSLKKNQKVQLVGFGSFSVAKRAARKGINPRTGDAIKIKASKSVRFKAGQTLKGAV